MKPRLSVIVNFFNMRREAARTLHTLSGAYQRRVDASAVEIIAIENGSSQPLGEDFVRSYGPHFSYLPIQSASASPAPAMNQALRQARGEFVLCLIDGARMLSPGVLYWSLKALQLFDEAYVVTLAMHIGAQVQNELVRSGYDQTEEDRLLAGVGWQENGYRLFEVSSLALSSARGFFSCLPETNCFAMRRQSLLDMGGFDERFKSPGGGLVNLDLANRILEKPSVSPVMLLGEASFHQFHGGVATNVPMSAHPWANFADEYCQIRGRPYEAVQRDMDYLGHLPPECAGLMASSAAQLAPDNPGQ